MPIPTKDELFDLYKETVDNISEMEERGIISDREADAHHYNLVNEFKEYLGELEGFDPEEFEEEYEDYIEVEPHNEFGAYLMEYGLENGYDDFNDYIDDLADACDCEPKDIIDMIVGDEEPDEETAMAIADMLELDDPEEEEFLETVPDYEDDEYEEEDMNGDADYGSYPPEDNYYDDRINELEDQVASFHSENILKETIADIDRQAIDLVEAGDLPPAAYRIIMGDFETDGDRVAAFSQTAASNGVGLDAELHAAGKVLDVFARLGLGELGLFDEIVDDEVSEFAMNEEQAVYEQAARNREYAKRRKAGAR